MKGTLRPGRKAGVLALAVLLLTCVLMAGAVSAADPTYVGNWEELADNLTKSDVDKIILTDDIYAEAQVNVTNPVTIEGNYHTITPADGVTWGTKNEDKHLIQVTSTSGSVTLQNLILDSKGKAADLHVYDTGENNQIVLENLLINGSKEMGLHVNGANVSATNLTIRNSGWGVGIDVQRGKVVTTTSSLYIDTLDKIDDLFQISDEEFTGGSNTASVYIGGTKTTAYLAYTPNKDETSYGLNRNLWLNDATVSIFAEAKVVNTSGPVALHTDLAQALTSYVDAGSTVTQLQDITLTEKLTINKEITFNGGGKTLTLNTPEKSTSITVNGGATLENLNVVAAENANFYIGIQLNDGTLKGSSIDLSEQTCDASARAVVISTGIVSGNTIQAGNSDTSSSQCVVVSGSDVTVSGNTLTTGKSAAEREGKRTSGSVGIRLSSGASGTTIIDGNTITSMQGAGLNNGIAADGVSGNVEIEASGNTFVLAAAKYGGGAFYVNPTTDVTTVTLDANGNTVESAASFIYADRAEGAETYAISGKIENNDFAAADKGLVSAAGLTLTLDDDFHQIGNSGLITDPSESLDVNSGESEITVTGATVEENGDNATITFTGYTILITNVTVSGSDTINYKDDSTAIVTHDPVRHMGSLTDIDVELLITDMSKLEEISTPKATIGDTEKRQLAEQKITPLSVVDIHHHHEDEPGFDQITLTISGLSSSGEIIGFHVGKSGVDTSEVTIIDGKHVVTFTDLTSASPFGIGVISDEPQPTPLPPSYSSGDGNMENAYRVLFNDGSTTLSVVTDLSSGDKLTKPATPVKDGYTFAGWYKDSACTQAWDFETGISGDMTLYAKWTAAGSSGETEATPTATSTAVTTPQPTKTQSTTATTSAPQATTAAGVSPTLTQAPAPVAGALFGLLAAGVLLRRRFQ